MRKGNLWMALGVVLLLGAIGLTLYNLWDAKRAGDASAAILAELDDATPETDPALGLDSSREMPTEIVDGFAYIGTIEFPALELRLPVMDTWDYDRLRVSPCRYSGSYFKDDLVICGHNYASHFSPIKYLEPGAEVIFTSVEGLELRYLVALVETVQPTAIEDMIDTDYDLTLFTCNPGGQTRCAVRCVRR